MKKQKGGHIYNTLSINILNLSHLLETRHDVTRDGADQGCDVIHEAFRETIFPGRL